MALSIKFDERELADLLDKLSPDLYEEAVTAGVIDTAHTAQAEIVTRTPRITGTAQRSWRTDERKAKRYPNPEAVVDSNLVYIWWLETGKDSRGRKMRTRPGGYRMRDEGQAATEQKVPQILDNVVREIEGKWSS